MLGRSEQGREEEGMGWEEVVKYMKEKAAEAERQRQRALEKARGKREERDGWVIVTGVERAGIVEGRCSGRDT